MDAPVHAGQVLAGKYQVERVLGAGAMGIVVAARHLHLDERVAIKFLQPETLKDPNVIARFLREGRAAAKIRSEHVARVYDVGSLDTGAPYLVMEYLEGSDLASLVKTHGPLPVPTAVDYVLQACEAIAEAHAAGIVHRDFKPSNLFMTTRADGSPVIKVIDFGISKITTGSAQGLDMTKTAEARGSPLFMSPEQMTAPRSVDARTDLWAIGISLHHLLTGGYPFYAQSVPELCGLVLQHEPAPLRAQRPDLPVGLEHIILRCLRRNPAERYADVAELATALGEFAPPLARLSVDRIRRVMAAIHAQTRGSLPSVPEIGMMPPERAPMAPLPPTMRLPMPSASEMTPSGPPQPTADQAQTGAASWGSNRSPAPKHSAIIAVALSLIGVAGAAAVAGAVWLRSHEAADMPSAVRSPEEAAPATPVAAPSVEVAPHEPQPVAIPPSADLPAPAPSAAGSAAVPPMTPSASIAPRPPSQQPAASRPSTPTTTTTTTKKPSEPTEIF